MCMNKLNHDKTIILINHITMSKSGYINVYTPIRLKQSLYFVVELIPSHNVIGLIWMAYGFTNFIVGPSSFC